ncbi:Nitrilase, member 2 [Chamberlinius hualienensis]
MFTQILLLLVTFVGASQNLEECNFVGAVYEHVNGYGNEFEGLDRMLANLDVYESQVREAAALGAQIIVFPENGITGTNWDSSLDIYYQEIQAYNSTWNPCLQDVNSNYTAVPHKLSCMARDYNIIVVANFPTSVQCLLNCNEKPNYHYNTDVVFDVDGTLITNYYKINLYGEPMFDQPPTDSGSIYFDTSFGRFGLLTCFDLLWYEPTIQVVQDYKVDSLLFPTAWMDQLPYLTSIQAQAAWAFGLRVNLLAANLFLPQEGFMGSGLYSGQDGPVSYIYSSDNINGTLLVNKLPCYQRSNHSKYNENRAKTNPDGSIDSPFHFIKHQNMKEFVGSALSEDDGQIEVCQGTICCDVLYEYRNHSSGSSRKYWLVMHQGNISEADLYTFNGEICSVLWCDNGELSLDTCAVNNRNLANITDLFNSLVITSNFTTPYIFPSVLMNDFTPLSNNLWTSSIDISESTIRSSLVINKTDSAILAVTLYARNYSLDPK